MTDQLNSRAGSRTGKRNPFSVLLLLLILGTGLCPRPARAGTAFLKINRYYVLYTAPIFPYRDHGTLIVSVEGFARLMRVKVHVLEGRRKVTFALAGHTLKFTAGKRQATLDGHIVVMPVAARLVGYGQDMVIPLKVLTDAYHVPSHWDPVHRILSVQAPLWTTRIDESEFAERTVGSTEPQFSKPWIVPTRLGIYPFSYWNGRLSPPDPHRLQQVFDIGVKNIGPYDLGQVYFNLDILGIVSTGDHQTGFSDDDTGGAEPMHGSPDPSFVRRGETKHLPYTVNAPWSKTYWADPEARYRTLVVVACFIATP